MKNLDLTIKNQYPERKMNENPNLMINLMYHEEKWSKYQPEVQLLPSEKQPSPWPFRNPYQLYLQPEERKSTKKLC